MTRLRFCMVTTFYPPYNFGGDGIAVQRLAHSLARHGHDVTVVCSTDAYRSLGGSAPDAEDTDDGVRVHRLGTALPRLSSLITQQTGRPVTTLRAIDRIVGAGRFDVINYHNVSLVGGPGVLGMGTAIKLYTAHEHWLVCPTHVLWKYGREPCASRDCFRCQLSYRRPPQLWRYTRFLEKQLAHVDTFIACSEFSRVKHREMGFPRDMVVIPPLVEETPYQVDASGPPHHRPYFLFVGRLERMKGLDDVLPIMREYADADLLVVGDGEHRTALQRIAAGSDRIRFVGRIPTERLGPYYAHAIAAIVPSVGYETFGVVAVEALRQGTPILARRLGPLTEIVESSGGGQLFSTARELRAAMQHMQHAPESRNVLADRGRAAFAERWSERATLAKYFEVIEAATRRRAQSVVDTLAGAR